MQFITLNNYPEFTLTGFMQSCIIHTPNFWTLKNHKICYEQQIDLKLAGFIKLLFLYHPCKVQICMLFLPAFMNLLNEQNRMCELCMFSQIWSQKIYAGIFLVPDNPSRYLINEVARWQLVPSYTQWSTANW